MYSNALETAETTIPKHFIRNLTNLDIPEDIIDVVSLGPKFSINEKINKNDIIDTLKKFRDRFGKFGFTCIETIRNQRKSSFKSQNRFQNNKDMLILTIEN